MTIAVGSMAAGGRHGTGAAAENSHPDLYKHHGTEGSSLRNHKPSLLQLRKVFIFITLLCFTMYRDDQRQCRKKSPTLRIWLEESCGGTQMMLHLDFSIVLSCFNGCLETLIEYSTHV